MIRISTSGAATAPVVVYPFVVSAQDVYDDWVPFLEWQDDVAAVDTAQELEPSLIINVANLPAGVSAGGPKDPGYDEPLVKKAYPPGTFPDDMAVGSEFDPDV